VWDIGRGSRLYSLQERQGNLRGPAISPDSRLLAWGIGDSRVGIWRTDDGKPLATLDTTVTCLSIAFSPDSRLLACQAGDGLIDIWDVNQSLADNTQNSTKSVSSLTSTSDGKRLAWSLRSGLVQVWANDNKNFR
jgi:WD40 repeat protein